MASIQIAPLQDDLSFGVRISGVTDAALEDEGLRAQLVDAFERHGMIVFENVDPTSRMHVAISNVFGPMKEHPVAVVERVDQDSMPGVIDMRHDPGGGSIVEIGGKQLAQWLPWHFDHCYNNELNRAGVLRAITIAEHGGLTGFADGIELYNALSPDLRLRMEEMKVIYTLDLRYAQMRFGLPDTFKEIAAHPGHEDTYQISRTLPRAIHPAVWQRATGEKVLHVSPWMAVGLEGKENAEGDALLEAVCQEILAKVKPYHHQWTLTDMLIWDNWRMLHSVSGCDPMDSRRMQRTTIKGDYGLGYFENGGQGHKILEMTV